MTLGVIAAHPDDEVLGCGGTVACLSDSHDVRILILGEGVSARFQDRKQAPAEEINCLNRAADKAAELLGARSVEFGGLPDNRFDTLALLDVVKLLEAWLEKWEPQIIYSHHMGDLNVDHTITARAVLTATRPMKGHRVDEIYAFEVPSSTEWAFQRFEPVFRPNVFMNIGSKIETKIEAMETYTSERQRSPHPRSPESLRAIGSRWGSVISVEYAEAFELIRMIR